ncbi:MAG: DUF1538 domain-containing protein [Acholeplasmataceae bacterium]|nr:DUF1538 domain-containing protein [Acholeplasmataceae bacterium]
MNILAEKFRDNIIAVVPITLVVLLLHFTLVPLSTPFLIRFLIGSIFVIIGLSLFLVGVDLGITPLGSHTGSTLTRTNKLVIVLVAGFVLGFFISIAEPGLLVFSNQVDYVTQGEISSISILISVSIGLAIMIGLGFIRIIYNLPLYRILLVLYLVIFVLAFFTTPEFLAISFDASGATTGVLAVPFLLALSVGITKMKKDSKSSEKDSFGLVSIASTGAIISLMVLSFFNRNLNFVDNSTEEVVESTEIIKPFISILSSVFNESFMALLPLLIILFILQVLFFKLSKRAFIRILKGFVYALLGLFIFLVGVNAGFMEIGSKIGYTLALLNHKVYLLIIAFFLGLFTIAAEPAVSVLTHQIEDITSGYVKRKAVLIPLSVGVGFAITLSILRILIPSLQLWHFLLPGYLISLALMFIVPKLFVGIAFDAGGVATGPMTATFILAFTTGAANATVGANVLLDGFGMIALVALAPIITLQLLGLVFKIQSRKEGV